MADLTPTSQEWWEKLLGEARTWYDRHVQKSPVERLTHEPQPSLNLSQKKWGRLEKRASTMLLMGIPETQREEMVATNQTSAMKIVCRLLTIYQPGGLAEKEVILRSLEAPQETTSLPDQCPPVRYPPAGRDGVASTCGEWVKEGPRKRTCQDTGAKD